MEWRKKKKTFCLACLALFLLTLPQAPSGAAENAPWLAERNDMLAAASVKKGHEISTACSICHTFDKGGPNMTGPNLWGIVGARHAHSDYDFSPVLRKMKDKIWTPDALDRYLKEPGRYAPGTTMYFGGLLDPQDRADLIAYLMTLK